VRRPAVKRRAPTNGHGVPTISDPTLKLLRARLEQSGLTPAHAQMLGITGVESARSLDPSFEDRRALRIPYWDPLNPGSPLTGWPKAPPFYRLRYLGEEPAGPGRAARARPRRYVQPPGSLPCAYFPRLRGLDWSTVLTTARESLLITEGELKAAKACAAGYCCIGLGGVWSFRSKDRGIGFLPELETIEWRGREVYLVYDSDVLGNADVANAANALSRELMLHGAFPFYVALPHEPDESRSAKKTGLDDYLVRCSPALFDELLRTAPPCTLARPLWDLNERVTLVADPGIVIEPATRHRMSIQTFKELYANVVGSARVVNGRGQLTMEPVSLAPVWLAWPFRRQVDRLTYAPGRPAVTPDSDGLTAHNTWPGWGCESVKGDVAPWTKLLDHLFTNAEPGIRLYFERWCAYQVQRPGVKMFVAIMIWGLTEGTGKTFLGELLGTVFGKNYGELTTEQFHSSFNEWAVDKQLIFGDELKSDDKRLDAETLRRFITQKTVRINIKHLPTYEVPDCVNYLLVSNNPDALYLSNSDRRYLVHHVTVGPLSIAFYDGLRRWKENGGGPAALRWHLEHLPLGDFDPFAPAPFTRAKAAMRDSSRTDVGAWCVQLREDPAAVLRVGDVASGRDLWTSKEILGFYDPQGRSRLSVVGMGRELVRAGFEQVNSGLPIRSAAGLARYFAVRNPARWLRASPQGLAAHLDGDAPRGRRKKFERDERG
jgi:hypothetical protein